MLLLLGGCVAAPQAGARSAKLNTGERASAAQPQVTTITWSYWGEPWETQVNRRIARVFEAEHPAIKVEQVHRSWTEYFTWLEEEWRQGRSPDVMFLNNVRGYAAAGHLEPLGPFLARDGFDFADFYPRLLSLFNLDGQYYGLPRDNDTKVIFYNTRLFTEAGLAPPRRGWTWADLLDLSLRLTRRAPDGRSLVYGFAFEPETWWRIWIWQNGGDLFDDPFRPGRVLLGQRPAREALQFLSNLMHVSRITPPYEEMRSSGQITTLFRQGRLAMAFGGHGRVPALAEEPGLQWNVAPLPVGRERVNLAGGAGYTISRLSEQKDAAWALVRFLESPKGQVLFAESGLMVPARRSVREDNIFLRRQPYDTQVFLEETEFGRPNLNHPLAPELNRVMEAGLVPVWRGERSVDQAVDQLVPQLEAALAR